MSNTLFKNLMGLVYINVGFGSNRLKLLNGHHPTECLAGVLFIFEIFGRRRFSSLKLGNWAP